MTSHLDGAFWAALPWTALGVLAVLAATYAASKIAGKHAVIDVAWGLLFCAVAVVAFVASANHGDDARRWLLLVLVLVWGLRLAVHIGRRSRGAGEDPRYEEFLRDRGELGIIAVVYGLQGVLAWVISAPVQVGMFLEGPLGVLAYVGAVVWVVGIAFEAVGDWQLDRYKAQPKDARPPVMDRGLWAWTRHPNYFGDACVWVGLFLVAADRWPGALTVFAPAIMVYLLAFGSGKRILERRMSQRPAYREYMERTSGFVPLPPKR
ncbi:DUF1295 domain-containing protein [Mumia zhuanghuii]|uniref:DUF1295 domain-containing protein n=1 Tax=Mumia zhuanghuii TaxID=2585211 RepID=A0A5C4MQ82_9ACTN|nr:DUF1295 domain-containing protein [Mumia zhuanghuii]TNC47069.1 DUF1295 domain-containing protein [Mumia zhuanghuii]TNC50375.1 DUF1295 domain-containing protein [Mumia zhuanghuii]